VKLRRRVRALERAARAMFPPPPELTLRDLARHDPEVLRLLLERREWESAHPGQDPASDPGCRADLAEITRRFEAFVKSPPRAALGWHSAARRAAPPRRTDG
jgi:hypothetical protein